MTWDHPYITSTFSDPPNNYVNIDTALNVGKTGHFIDLTSESKKLRQSTVVYMIGHFGKRRA